MRVPLTKSGTCSNSVSAVDAADALSRTAERSLIEISDLQSTLANNLAIQSAQIDQLVQDSDLTAENLGKGNKELKQATERTRTARLAFFATVLYCFFLIIWDLIF